MARQGTFRWPTAYAVPPRPSPSGQPSRGWSFALGRAESSGLSDAPRHSRRLHGRLAAVFFAGSGVLILLTLPIPVPGLDLTVMAALATVAFAIGIVTWSAPWHRWPRQASLVLIPPAFALITMANAFGAGSLQPYGVFFLVVFVWLGVAHPPRTSLAAAPIAALAYVLPSLHVHGGAGGRVYSAALTIPLCVLVGEGIAWTAERLERMELALRRERDRSERLRELDEMKDRLLSAVSHELRTPITVFRGHLDVLADGAGEQELRTVKETLCTELDLMTRLVEDLTTLARADDRAQLRTESLPLNRFMTSVAEQGKTLLGYRLQVEPGVPGATLRADPQRLTQALLNLLRNAAQHTRGEEPVRFRVVAEPACWRFEVADEGGGLPAGDEEAVFEAFRTLSRATGGTGLGLSIVRGIARAHGGEADVVNRPGLGATFRVRIPR